MLSLFLILFVSISAISAANANEENVALDMNQNEGNLEVSEASESSAIASTANEEILTEESTAATSPISFSDFESQIRSTSNLVLTSDVAFKAGDSSKGIGIGQALTIDGKGHTIDAKGKARVFQVARGATLTLKNLKIVNAYVSGADGGAILSSGTLKLTNCNFTSCKVVGSKRIGGAIAGAGAGSIVNCRFDRCSATYGGGAASSNNLKFTNCKFTNNVAGSGGGIMGTAYLYSCYFNNCIATHTATNQLDDLGGGAGNGWFPHVEKSTFVNCKSTKGYGGALRGTTNSYNCVYTNCVAKRGGAIGGKGENVGCNFTNCIATSSMGGAIFTEKANIKNCNFIKCSSLKSNAGAVFIGNNVNIIGCKFTNCTAKNGYGGAIYGNGVITKCGFTGNSAKFGGAISSYSITVKASTFTGNVATKGGAGFNVKTFTSCVFNKNRANFGGALYNAQNAISCKFTDNYAKAGSVSFNDVNVVFQKAGIKNTIQVVQGLFYNHKHKLTLTASSIVNTGKFNKYLNYNTGTFIYSKNTLKSTPKAKVIAGPNNVKR